MSNDNENSNWNDNYNWYHHESGLAPVMVMITITELELNLKCNYTCTCDLPQSVLNLNLKLYLTLSCKQSIFILKSMTNWMSLFYLQEHEYSHHKSKSMLILTVKLHDVISTLLSYILGSTLLSGWCFECYAFPSFNFSASQTCGILFNNTNLWMSKLSY